MSNLRSLTNTFSITKTAPITPVELLVANTNMVQMNGGCCCLLTMPAGSTWATFEIWGGGASGAGACCCQQGPGGSAGSYSSITVCSSTLAGCQYTICAGGSSCATPGTTSCGGFTSYVTGYGLSNFCATGGTGGPYTRCFAWISCHTCFCAQAYNSTACGGTLNVQGTSGSELSGMGSSCYFAGQQMAAVAPKTVSGPIFGPGGCINGTSNGSCACFMCAVFPGGGGLSAQAYGGNCWNGGWGAPGAVFVIYG